MQTDCLIEGSVHGVVVQITTETAMPAQQRLPESSQHIIAINGGEAHVDAKDCLS